MGSSSYNWVVGLLLFLIIFLEMSAVTFGDDHSLEESKVGYNNGCRYGRRGCAGRGVPEMVMDMVEDLELEVVLEEEEVVVVEEEEEQEEGQAMVVVLAGVEG
ncbi:hypothetical protein AABB24_012892 [Solanum stoloniferum]|uniref:Glycine-rich protein n=1 Tax=Solanum stoloniferum TaxID=62892 RepID=A0ABD2U6C0_9SOLN